MQMLAKLSNLKIQMEATIRLLEQGEKEITYEELDGLTNKYGELLETIWNR